MVKVTLETESANHLHWDSQERLEDSVAQYGSSDLERIRQTVS